MRGSGKTSYLMGIAIHQILQDSLVHGTGAMSVSGDFRKLEAKALNWGSLIVLDDVEVPHVKPELTDFDPRGADRLKGPKGPRTKWGNLK